MDAEDTPTVWIVEHGRFPFCVELGAGDTLTRFDSALRAFGTPLPVGRKVVFLHGQVWIGTDRGLFCYHPEADSWDRLRLPGSRPDAAVSALTVEDGQLRVTWATAAGRQMQGSFSLESGVWETTVPP
jgi:ligand-binding sensor domain-containing protein